MINVCEVVSIYWIEKEGLVAEEKWFRSPELSFSLREMSHSHRSLWTVKTKQSTDVREDAKNN